MSAKLNYKEDTKLNYMYLVPTPNKRQRKLKLFINKYEEQIAAILFVTLIAMAIFILTHCGGQ